MDARIRAGEIGLCENHHPSETKAQQLICPSPTDERYDTSTGVLMALMVYSEQNRMDLLHAAIDELFGHKPLYFGDKVKREIKRVLDVGTGTGIWAINMADEHPNAEVVGTDISFIQPTWVELPSRLAFSSTNKFRYHRIAFSK